jgi:hypothetical protein
MDELLDTRERRIFPRVTLLRPFRGRVIPLQMLFVLRDINLGGFAIEAPISIPRGTAHPFEFTLADARQVVLKGTAVYCLRMSDPHTDPAYLVGFVFARDHEEDRRTIERLVKIGQ